jgi:imidazole glycerol-phosphate synthase subunit HisF
MLKTRVMPCLLLRNRGLVKTIHFKDPSYVGDPINTIRIFNEKEVDELILLDITATAENKKPNFSLIFEVASECFMPLTYGGGIRSVDDAKKIISLGVEKIAINSFAFEKPDFIRELADLFGSQSIIVSIDAKKNWLGKYTVHSNAGKLSTRYTPIEWAVYMEKIGAGEILLTSIDRDGTFEGYDIALIEQVALAVNVPVIACGGAGKIEDFTEAVVKGNASAVAAGSMVVYQGKNRAVLINFPARQELATALP